MYRLVGGYDGQTMKAGDLVKMKYTTYWAKKNNPRGKYTVKYTEAPLLVYEAAKGAVKILYPDGTIKTDLAEYYEIISER